MRIAFSIIIALWSLASIAQTPLTYARYAEEALESGDYYGASVYYHQANGLDSTQHDWFWQEATALRLFHQYDRALDVYRYIDSHFGKEYPELPVYIALCQKSMGEYADAKATLEAYMATRPSRSSYAYRKAEQELAALEMAAIPQEVSDWELDTLGAPYNTREGEYAPIIHHDSLYITRFESAMELGEEHDIFINRTSLNASDKEESEASLDAPIEWRTARQITYSYDQEHAYAVVCDREGCRIEYAARFGSGWTVPEALNADINLEGARIAHVHYAEIAGKDYILFSSNRPRTKGGMDLWMAEIKKHGEKYGRTKSLGRNINDRDDQITPFYDTASSALYFSSNWHVGYGGFDVFSTQGNGRSWSEPSNMGMPINSIGNDMYFARYGDTAYWASNRPGSLAAHGEMCCNDIYRGRIKAFEVDTPLVADYPDSIIISEQPRLEDFQPITLYFHNDRPNPRSYTDTTELSYMDTWQQYRAQRGLYLEESSDPSFAQTFFDSILTTATMQLDTLYARLNYLSTQGYEIHLGVRGYTSSLAKNNYNSRLAERRIVSFSNGLYQQLENKDDVHVQNIPLGEFFSEFTVNDDINDVKESVYGPAAMVSRRVEVIALSIEKTGASNLHLEEYFIDLGVLTEGEQVDLSFKLENRGSESIELSTPQPGCGCSEAAFADKIIDAGQSTQLDVHYNSIGKVGAQLVPIYFATQQGEFVVYLKVYIQP